MAAKTEQDALAQFLTSFPEHAKTLGLEQDDLTIWSVSLANLSSVDTLTTSQKTAILKFLRARDLDVVKAVEMMGETLKWRKEFKVDQLMDETFSEDINKLGFVHGRDKSGCPVTYNFYGSVKAETLDIDQFVRWRIQLMEKAIKELDFDKGVDVVMQVHDYTNASVFMPPTLKAASKRIIALFQAHYPELLSKKLFLYVPKVMETLFFLFSSFVPQRTRSKFVMAGSTRSRQVLLEYVDPHQLPEAYGGFSKPDVTTVTVSAGKKHRVELPVVEGKKVSYEMMTVAYDVGVSAFVEKEEDKGKGADVEAKKIEHGKGTVDVKFNGIFVLLLDNSYSYMTEKKVFYRIDIE